MTLVLDAGALIAADRGDRDLMALVKRERLAERAPRTHGGVVGQVWRGGGPQATLAVFLRAIEVVSLDDELGRASGVLLGQARMSDVVDAAVVLLAADGDQILTSDTSDLASLAGTAGLHVDVVLV